MNVRNVKGISNFFVWTIKLIGLVSQMEVNTLLVFDLELVKCSFTQDLFESDFKTTGQKSSLLYSGKRREYGLNLLRH